MPGVFVGSAGRTVASFSEIVEKDERGFAASILPWFARGAFWAPV